MRSRVVRDSERKEPMRNNIRIAVIASFAAVFFVFPALFADAKPKYMKVFNEDKTTKVEYHDSCGVCHVSRLGGGERTYFGDAFDEAGNKITPEMRKKYSNFFNPGEESPKH